MAITLVDELALEQPILRKGVIQTIVEESPVFRRIPYETTGALSMPVVYVAGVPTVPLRHINETPATSEASFAQATETLHIIDTDIDIDPVLLDNKNQVQKLDVAQTQAVVKALASRVVDLSINGDPVSDAREPLGLKKRLTTETRFNGQTVNANGSSTTKVRIDPGGTDADKFLFLYRLDELMAVMEDKVSAFITSSQVKRGVWSALRQAKLLATTQDQFERDIVMYRGVPILDAGFKPASAVTGSFDAHAADTNQVIGNDADDYDAGDPGPGNGATAYVDSSTIYAVRWGSDATVGLQQTPMRVKPFGETEAAPHLVRTNIRWVLHPAAVFQKRAIGRLIGIDATQA